MTEKNRLPDTSNTNRTLNAWADALDTAQVYRERLMRIYKAGGLPEPLRTQVAELDAELDRFLADAEREANRINQACDDLFERAYGTPH